MWTTRTRMPHPLPRRLGQGRRSRSTPRAPRRRRRKRPARQARCRRRRRRRRGSASRGSPRAASWASRRRALRRRRAAPHAPVPCASREAWSSAQPLRDAAAVCLYSCARRRTHPCRAPCVRHGRQPSLCAMPLLLLLFLRPSGRSRQSSTRAARARLVSMDREKLKRSMERKRLFSEAEDEAMLRAWLRCAPLPHRGRVRVVGPLTLPSPSAPAVGSADRRLGPPCAALAAKAAVPVAERPGARTLMGREERRGPCFQAGGFKHLLCWGVCPAWRLWDRHIWLRIGCQFTSSVSVCRCAPYFPAVPSGKEAIGHCADVGQGYTCVHDSIRRAAQHPFCRACGACALPRHKPASPRPRLRLAARARTLLRPRQHAPLPAACRWHARHGFAREAFTSARNRLAALGMLESQARPGAARAAALAHAAPPYIRACWHMPPAGLVSRNLSGGGGRARGRPAAAQTRSGPDPRLRAVALTRPLPPRSGQGLTLGRGRQARSRPCRPAQVRAKP